MKNRTDNRHMVDILFVLALFVVFAFSALMLVILGANVYKKTVNDMDDNFTGRTAHSYLTEKIRQSDVEGAINIISFGEGTDALCITRTEGTASYATVLYVYDGNLCELNARKEYLSEPESGTALFPMQDMTIEKTGSHLFTITLNNGEEETVLNVYCASAQ